MDGKVKSTVVFIVGKYTIPFKINPPVLTYVCDERIFDRLQFTYNKIFLEKHLYKFVAPTSFGTFCTQIGQSFEAQ